MDVAMTVGSEDQARSFFERMLRIRIIEETIAARYGKPGEPQEMRCPVHLSIGQEAVAVGVCATLTDRDHVFSTHRCHAHYLAKGGALEPMLGEIYGKATGCVGGRGGSMHLMDISVGMQASIPIVASVIPLALGAALAFKMDGLPNISTVFFGDAAMEEGVWHESANFARLRDLPVLFVCENNLYSVYTPLNQRQPDGALRRFAEAHALPVFAADGNDVEAVYTAASKAVDGIRSGDGPAFLLFDTYRFREHCGPNFDDHLGYRAHDEVAHWQERDPVVTYESALRSRGSLSAAGIADLRARLEAEVEAAFVRAREAPLPSPSAAADHVYA